MERKVIVTGDTHGIYGTLSRLNEIDVDYKGQLSKKDVVIILGDFGCVWANNPYGTIDYHNDRFHLNMLTANDGESEDEREALDKINNYPFTVAFLDGNHDNHPRLNTYPAFEWCGGMVHEIRPSVLHLMRGETYKINDKTFWVMGGAQSHDISDGIVVPESYKNMDDLADEIRRREKGRELYRVKHYSWWKEEIPSREEFNNGKKHLEECEYEVNYVLTHTCPSSVSALMGYSDTDELAKYLEDIRSILQYDKWLFGHMHRNKAVTDKEICYYSRIERIM